jgi:DNA-directed RNA polymerase specialized sigma24 family protein
MEFEDAQQFSCQILARCCLKYRRDLNIRFTTYLFGSIKKGYIDEVRAKCSLKRGHGWRKDGLHEGIEAKNPFEVIDAKDEVEAIGNYIGEKMCSTLKAQFVDKRSTRELANEMGVHRVTYRARVREANKRIREVFLDA